jgi:AcrR family transcriptional regulator
VLEGVVRALNQFGYGAATTDVICRSARVARGGLLHHFPSKAGLMAAVADHCLERMADERRARRSQTEAAFEDILMGSLLEPYGVALSELIVASRSDGALKARLGPLMEHLIARQAHAGDSLARRWGVSDTATLATMVYLHMAARRGLAMLALAGAPQDITIEALALLRRYTFCMRKDLTTGDRQD